MTIAENLADIVHRSVNAHARERTALHVLDWIGCAALGAVSEAGAALQSWAADEADGPCSVVGGGKRSLSTACIVNGALGNVLEMDDVHRTSILHPGPVIVPAALAVAERQGNDGADLLDAIVRGYEATIRIGAAVGPTHYRFWHNTATCGPFGAAAAAASLLGLDRKRLVWAMGNAGTQAGGLWQMRHEPVMTKQLHNGRAAYSGVLSAELAARGFSGPATILEGVQGFFAAMCPDGDPQRVVGEPEGEWRIFDTSFKPWPACRHAHPAIDAALLLYGRFDRDQIESIGVKTYRDALTFCDRPIPETQIQAKFSLQHSVAVTLLDGPPALAAFEPAAIVQPRVATVRQLVQVEAAEPFMSSYPQRYGAAVAVRLKDGTTMEATAADALGDPANPLAPEAIVGKARMLLSAAGVEQGGIESIIDATLGLAHGGSVTRLTDVLL